MRYFAAAAALAALLAVGAPIAGAASVPDAMNYQGELHQADGSPVPDGVYGIAFRIYDEDENSGGATIWGRSYDVPVTNGVFNVILGDPGGQKLTAEEEDISEAFDAQTRYMGITVLTDENGEVLADPDPQEMRPRQQILSSPYAIKAFRADNGVPVGTVLLHAGRVAPPGFLLCRGDFVNTSDYPDLFAVIGTTWGGTEERFNLPDLRGRVPMGAGPGHPLLTERFLGEKLGEETHTLTEDEMPEHDHRYNYELREHKDDHETDEDDVNYDVPNVSRITEWADTRDAGDDQPHNNIQPSAVVNYIIRY